MRRARVVGREGDTFILADGTRARMPGAPLIDDEVTVDDDGVIREVHRVRTAFGYEAREEVTR